MDGNSLSQVGFGEFVGKLLSEVFDAVVTSQLDQRRRIDDLADSARLTEEEVASRFVDEPQVEAEIANLFPTGVNAGAPYRPGAPAEPETPPFNALLGLTLKAEKDFVSQGTETSLTAAGVERVREGIRLRLARSYLGALRVLVTRGAPQLLIDSGKVAAKVTFQLASGEPAEVPAPTSAFSSASMELRRKFGAPAEGRLAAAAPSPFRLAVRQASDRTPQVSRLQVDVYGEVEVRFRILFA